MNEPPNNSNSSVGGVIGDIFWNLLEWIFKSPVRLIFAGISITLLCTLILTFPYRPPSDIELTQIASATEAIDFLNGISSICGTNYGEEGPTIQGKVYFWDAIDKERMGDEYLHEIEARNLEEASTVVIIMRQYEIPVARYSSGRVGFRIDQDICVIYWPSRDVVGRYTLTVGEPPDLVPLIPMGKITGGGPDPLFWVESLSHKP